MTRIKTDYTLDGSIYLYYEVLDDGFDIYVGESALNPLYHQPEPYIPNPDLSYEENAINMCKEISTPSKFEGSSLDNRLLSIEANVDYLMLLNDSTDE